MLKSILEAVDFMGRKSRNKFGLLVLLRGATALIDLGAILGLGVLVAALVNSGPKPIYFSTVLAGIDFTNPRVLQILSLCLLGAFVAKAVLSVVLLRVTSNFLGKQEKHAIRQILENVLSHGIYQMQKKSREEIQFAVQIGAGAAYSGLLGGFATLVAEAALFLIILSAFFFINVAVTSALIFYLALIATVVILVVGKKQAQNSKYISIGTIEANKNLSDAFDNFREISTSGYKDKFVKDIVMKRSQVIDRISNQNLLYGLPRHIIETAVIAGILLAAFATIGNLTTEYASLLAVFAMGSLRIVAAMLPWQAAFSQVKLLVPEARVALDLLKERGFKSAEINQVKRPKSFEIKFENTSFSYGIGEKFSITDFNLTIRDKEFLGIVGASGSGKSTLIDLALGLLSPSAGKVTIANLDSGQLINSFPGLVAYVPQRPALIRGTVADNVCLGAELTHADKKKVLEILRRVGLAPKIQSLPAGIDTEINGTSAFSGGELQRLGLARALFSNPKVLVLDEITSGLDQESEAGIAQILAGLKGKITIVVVAHRNKTVEIADRIIKISQGAIIGSGYPNLILGE